MADPRAASTPILTVEDLSIRYAGAPEDSLALDHASFTVERGDRVGLVGESGSGKSTLASAVLRMLAPGAQLASGRIEFDGEDLLGQSGERMRALRSTRLARVPQDPLGSLNPVFTVGRQLADVVRAHRPERIGRRELRSLVERELTSVGIGDAALKRRSFAHELSGGMRQRVVIAMALINRPDLLIADEPTTALDATVQAQVIELLRERVASADMTLMLISHDIGVISELCTRVLVMYQGRIVEQGSTREVLTRPSHPYTRSLLDAARGHTAAAV
ncbi:ABC transporter ATP-binding protein [Sciscionella marina]|uniref:ABC transporter ATP-binding protein n=1 Tax=Sciscionella marina TaxID=508770 RepID=UPI00036C9B88|nr:ABC transporter ATP-binding protein [Sciscionella marina]